MKCTTSARTIHNRLPTNCSHVTFLAGHACFARANGLGHPCFAHRVVNQHAQNEGDEDQEAGFAGATFVQPAHDEEWMEYIDWGEVEAQAGGSSSSGA